MDRLPHQPHKVDVAINIDETLLLEKIWASVLGPEREKLESEWHWRYAHTFINFTLRILQHQGKIRRLQAVLLVRMRDVGFVQLLQ